MYRDSDNFEQLRRLLALKRHEQPPPGYFNSFSREVCARIQAGERATDSSLLGRLSDLFLLQPFWGSLGTQPILAGVVGIGACVFLLAGIISTEKMDIESQVYMG